MWSFSEFLKLYPDEDEADCALRSYLCDFFKKVSSQREEIALRFLMENKYDTTRALKFLDTSEGQTLLDGIIMKYDQGRSQLLQQAALEA